MTNGKYLAKNLGSLRWFVRGSQVDAMPLSSSIEHMVFMGPQCTKHAALSPNFRVHRENCDHLRQGGKFYMVTTTTVRFADRDCSAGLKTYFK